MKSVIKLIFHVEWPLLLKKLVFRLIFITTVFPPVTICVKFEVVRLCVLTLDTPHCSCRLGNGARLRTPEAGDQCDWLSCRVTYNRAMVPWDLISDHQTRLCVSVWPLTSTVLRGRRLLWHTGKGCRLVATKAQAFFDPLSKWIRSVRFYRAPVNEGKILI